MAAGNDVDTDSNPRSIVARRVFDAPRDLVFAVWTDPKHLAQWWGPDGFTTTTQSFDMRPGGIWRFVMHGPDGRDFQNRITYEEVARPERIVYRHGGGEDVEPVKFKTTVTFEELKSAAGSKTRITMRMDFPSAAERNRVIKEYGAAQGLAQTLARLAEHVANTFAERELTFTRIFDAPRALVFAAWTDSKHLAQWWGPQGFTNPVCEIEPRVGGAIRIHMRGPDTVVHKMKGEVREIIPPERLAFTNIAIDDSGNHIIEGFTTVTFAEENGKTKLTLHTRGAAVVEYAAAFIKGMEAGWTQSLERLQALMTRGAQDTELTAKVVRSFRGSA